MVLWLARVVSATLLLAVFARGQVSPCREYQLAMRKTPTQSYGQVDLRRGPRSAAGRVRRHRAAAAGDRSLTLELPARERIAPHVSARKLYLLDLAGTDPYGFELRFCTDLARTLGLFPSHVQFARVAINRGRPRLYLEVERPVDALRREHAQTVAVHMLRDAGTKTQWRTRSIGPPGGLLRLAYALEAGTPDLRATRLGRVLDLEALYTWLALRQLLGHRGHGAALILFEQRGDDAAARRLGVMDWEFGGQRSRREHSARATDVCSTTAIEREIQRNPRLHRAYRKRLANLLFAELHPERLLAQVAKVRRELRVLAPTTGEHRQQALDCFRNHLLARHRALVQSLDPAAKPGK